ncbi:hypothetical protein [Halococcus sp. PRR34]|uniref:hypothetical protein n=1 Tax=Halococcus sp. PRR34 TaxID=3020830 RepID=UPI0023613BDD|nr:hypothetical protein [Halococcus sp. PRR34]
MVTFDPSIDYPIESETIEEVAAEYDLETDEIRNNLPIAAGEETHLAHSPGRNHDYLEGNPDYVCFAPTGSPIAHSWVAWLGNSYGALEEGGTKKDQHRDAVRVTFNRQAEKLGIPYDTDVVLLWTHPVGSLEHFGFTRDEARAYIRSDAGESLSDIANKLEMSSEEVQNLISEAESKRADAKQTLEDLDEDVLQAVIAMRPPMGTSMEDIAHKLDKDTTELSDVYEKAAQDDFSDKDPTSSLILFTKGGESYSEVYEMASLHPAD